MNQQREVIYSLRAFALEGGEELKGEALKMVEKALGRRVETVLAEYDTVEEWDFDLLRQELLVHYMIQLESLENPDLRPTDLIAAQQQAVEAGQAAFAAKLESLDQIRDELGGYGDRLLRYVMLNVLDEKWKDHLYDLDQLRNAIHYRSWGQQDPLIEYKQEAYSMFVDLMHDIADTFTDRFLKVQLIVEQGPPPEDGRGGPPPPPDRPAPTRRYNALGVLEDVEPEPEPEPAGVEEVLDVGPAETPAPERAAAKRDPVIVGAGRARSLADAASGAGSGPVDWSSVGRNDPCPCGSGKKFKKCHGATL
jgi:preprotein translocase subunit SecA